MEYDASKNWEKGLAVDILDNSFPAQGLIRLIKGNYPNLRKIGDRLRALDLGCGDGRNSKFLHDMGHETIGLEISQKIIGELEKKYPMMQFIVGQNSEIPLPEDSVDLIVAWNSIYYMGPLGGDILENFRECARVLKSGSNSRLIVSVPMPSSFIYKNSITISENFDVKYQKITEDPYNLRVGETLAMFPDLNILKHALQIAGFSDFEVGEEMGDWFGRQYDWWVVSCSPLQQKLID